MENNYNNNFNSGSPYPYNQTNQQTGDGTNTSWSGQVNGNTSQGYSQGTQYGQTYSQGGQAYGQNTQTYQNGSQTQYGQGNACYSQGTQPYGQNQQKKKRKEKVKKEHGKGGFGVKLAKCAAIALVFGLISGSVFAGTNQLLGTKWSNSESAKTEASLNKSSSGDTVKAANTSSKAVTDLTDVSDIVDNVMPLVRRKYPDTQITVVGSGPNTESLKRYSFVKHLGYVKDISHIYDEQTIFVVPLFEGSGIRIKILEAFNNEIAVVSTTLGCETIGAMDKKEILIADDAEEFAESIISLFENYNLRLKIIQSAKKLLEDKYTLKARSEEFRSIMESPIV